MQEILTLFDINKPTMPRACNVLEGLNQGQILVDDPLNEMIPLDFDDGGRTYFFTERLISYISLNNHW